MEFDYKKIKVFLYKYFIEASLISLLCQGGWNICIKMNKNILESLKVLTNQLAWRRWIVKVAQYWLCPLDQQKGCILYLFPDSQTNRKLFVARNLWVDNKSWSLKLKQRKEWWVRLVTKILILNPLLSHSWANSSI